MLGLGVPSAPDFNMVVLMFTQNEVHVCTYGCLKPAAFGLPNLRAGGWHHFVMTEDAGHTTRRFYLNGTLFGEMTAATSAPFPPVLPDGQFHLGWGMEGCEAGLCVQPEWQLTASIDEFRIFNRTLTAEEVCGHDS